ncbi:MAG: ferric reductase-like transmembrane domain-containing protein [Candidatus Levybacteria bacterium]|nr:ferric reductase-like transmembrane domain-containing protein [Candidatus Levybacteria bacterium]
MMSLFSNIRFYVLILSVVLSLGEYFFIQQWFSDREKVAMLVPLYAYTALVYLYLAMLAGPLTKVFPFFPFRASYLKARRAIGVSAFYFGVLHARFAFYDFLGGFAAIPFLDTRYRIALVLSSTAILILTLMAATSFDYMVKLLTFPKWKMLHRFVYVAAIFILIHAILIGTRFQEFLIIRIVLGIGTVFLVGLHIVGLLRMYKIFKAPEDSHG